MCLNPQENLFCVNTVRNYSEIKGTDYKQRAVARQTAKIFCLLPPDSAINGICCHTKVM